MAVGSMGDWEAITSGGELWSGHTGPQIAVMFATDGLLDQLGDQEPILEVAKGLGRLGMNLTLT